MMLEDLAAGALLAPSAAAPEAVDALLQAKGIRYVTYSDWLKLDKLEIERGAATGRPRLKFSRVEEMLEALG